MARDGSVGNFINGQLGVRDFVDRAGTIASGNSTSERILGAQRVWLFFGVTWRDKL